MFTYRKKEWEKPHLLYTYQPKEPYTLVGKSGILELSNMMPLTESSKTHKQECKQA